MKTDKGVRKEHLFLCYWRVSMYCKVATLQDFEEAYSFIQALWDYNDYPYQKTFEVYQRILKDKNSFTFFLEDDGIYQGFCHGNYFDTFWMNGKTCYVSSLITKEEVRQKGYGKAMMDYALNLARKQDCKAVILCSGMPRKQAHQFYENYGFEKGCYGFELLL